MGFQAGPIFANIRLMQDVTTKILVAWMDHFESIVTPIRTAQNLHRPQKNSSEGIFVNFSFLLEQLLTERTIW